MRITATRACNIGHFNGSAFGCCNVDENNVIAFPGIGSITSWAEQIANDRADEQPTRRRGRPKKPALKPQPCSQDFETVCREIVALAARQDGTWAAAKEDLRYQADREGFRPSTRSLLGFLLKHINLETGFDWHSAETIADELGLTVKTIEYGFSELGQKGA